MAYKHYGILGLSYLTICLTPALRKMAALILLFLFFLRAVPCVADQYDYRPFLHIDGKNLSAHLVSSICSNLTNFDQSRLEHMNTFKSGWFGMLGWNVASDPSRDMEHQLTIAKWIFEQNDYSITPLDLAKKAIEVEDGNPLAGLRLIYNLLSAGSPRSRTNNLLFSKLVDITGEQKMAQDAFRLNKDKKPPAAVFKPISSRGSKPSAWYHFFGAAMIALDEGLKRPPFPLGSLEAMNAKLMGKLTVGTMVQMETIFDHSFQLLVYGSYYVDSKKRYLINWEGVQFGASLAEYLILIREKTSCDNFAQPTQPYLTDRPDLYGDDYPLKMDQYPTKR